MLLSDGQVYRGWGSLFDERRVTVYEVHGLWMFFAWMPLGYLLLATKRYLKGNWKLWHLLHILGGFFVLAITIWQAIEISRCFGWGWTDDVHSILGTMTIAATIISVLSGTLAAAFMGCYDGDQAWSSKKETGPILGRIHAWSSYFVLFFANVIVLGGTITYCLSYLKDQKLIPFGVISFMFFVNLVLVSEILHRKKARSVNLAAQQMENELTSVNGRKNLSSKRYTAQQLDIEVEQGEKLLLLDNLVLNTNGYER